MLKDRRKVAVPFIGTSNRQYDSRLLCKSTLRSNGYVGATRSNEDSSLRTELTFFRNAAISPQCNIRLLTSPQFSSMSMFRPSALTRWRLKKGKRRKRGDFFPNGLFVQIVALIAITGLCLIGVCFSLDDPGVFDSDAPRSLESKDAENRTLLRRQLWASPRGLVGADGRKRVVKTKDFPYSSVVLVETGSSTWSVCN